MITEERVALAPKQLFLMCYSETFALAHRFLSESPTTIGLALAQLTYRGHGDVVFGDEYSLSRRLIQDVLEAEGLS